MSGQCSLKASGCGSAISVTSRVSFDSSTGELKADQNVEAGYEEDVCIECDLGATNSKNSFKIKQIPDC